MKTKIAILVLLAATSLSAQEQTQDTTPPTTPDYSKPALQRFVMSIPEPPPPRVRNVRFHVGAVEFGAMGTRWRFNYLPIMTPLSGSRLGVTQEWPDPFSLTGTAVATPKRAWRTQREVNAELRRIEKSERAKIKVNTK